MCPLSNYMKTRDGVYYNLDVSTYRFKVPDTNVVLVFSSDFYLCKFEEQYIKHREEFNTRMLIRYKVDVDMKTLPDIILYSKIEKRGFLIIDERGKKLCQNKVKCGLEKVMLSD